MFSYHGSVLAEWVSVGGGEWYLRLCKNLISSKMVIGKLGEWIDEGPPKPSYRITRTFEQKPSYVSTGEWGKEQRGYIFISDDDIEEA